MRSFRCNTVFTHAANRLNVIPLFASRAQAIRYAIFIFENALVGQFFCINGAKCYRVKTNVVADKQTNIPRVGSFCSYISFDEFMQVSIN